MDANFALALERVRRRRDHGLDTQQPDFDPKQRREMIAEMSDGRKEEQFLQVLRYYRFEWRSSRMLPVVDGYRAQEGRWENKKLGMAFTPEDLTTGFPGGPQQFDAWMRTQIAQRRMHHKRLPKTEIRKLLAKL